MSWYSAKASFLLDGSFPNLNRGVEDDWIWEVMNTETFPTGWQFIEVDYSLTAGGVLVFEIGHAPRQMEFTAVEAVLQMMEKKYAER